MTHLWDPNDLTRTVRLTTDNDVAADTYNYVFEENSSLDIWDEIRWWQKLWGPRFVVEWKRGHPEKRQPDSTKWTPDEWRNHGADRLCDVMYYNNMRIRPEMFAHGRTWYWKHGNQRIVDNNRDIYTDILAHESLQALCPGAGIE